MNSVISLALLLTSIASTHAQDDNATATTTAIAMPTVCSCSPTIFTFVLSLDQTCDDNDIELNDGIDGSFCFTEEGVAVPAPPVVEVEEAATNATTMDVANNMTDTTNDLEPVRRRLQASDPVTEIISVQFLEFDTSGDLTVINQDDSYADVSLADGDRLKFASASSFLDTSLPLDDQMSTPALVPGGASLILYGKTESGVIVRNRFFWMYDMNCGRDNEPVKVDDEIGWVTVAEVSNAWPTFCPALPAGSPTIAPKSNEPTLTPSKSPTLKPSMMSMDITAKPTEISSVIPPPSPGHGPAFSKASKVAKHLKSKVSKTAKGSKGSSSKSAKSSKSSKGSKTFKSKALADHDAQYVMGKVGVFVAERSNINGASAMNSLGMVMSFLVGSLLLARQ
mmetsp:Transcript_16754/g.36180  ORF Transcript_16754/g.36180 Transcript_16754/m.36180 type:complete len:395 (+) Transcript_16754:180-1364(+)|eukprot:CAMPEP_0172323568 /NCGR_PEP_ID=MMETSP1058-20130122/49065_1 /TAXON_ID=83371 /ORGANISM="Detonula confervacea, Strain CCMP 353" /LENGTH=394 /DNA_ID=CAMNT_0013039611 /DNA_START=159 /DNA_END=1343 /DNA_ORIENTATION=+